MKKISILLLTIILSVYSVGRADPGKAETYPFQLEYVKAELPVVSDSIGSGFGPLFITGAVARDRNSAPESTTMLLLGLGLIGIAGYGGRKKFKN